MAVVKVYSVSYARMVAWLFGAIIFVCMSFGAVEAQDLVQEDTTKPVLIPPGFKMEDRDSTLDAGRYSVAQQKQMMPAEQMARLQTARAQMKVGDYEGASALLELIYRDYPGDPRVVNLLTDCYIELKRYFSAVEILTRQSRMDPTNMYPHLQLADVYFKAEKPDSALQEIDYALGITIDSLSIRRNLPYITNALQLLMDNWQDSVALEYAYSLRTDAGDSLLFGDEIAECLEKKKDYDGAIRESLILVCKDTTLNGIDRRKGDRRIAQLLTYPEAQPVVRRSLEDIIKLNPADTVAMRYLGELYMRTEAYEDAFDLYVNYDSITGEYGKKLTYYLRECYDRHLYQLSQEMGERILTLYPNSPTANLVRFYVARSYAEMGDTRSAVQQYNYILDHDPLRSAQADAACEIGDLYLYTLMQPDSAESFYNTAIKAVGGGATAWRAEFGLYDIQLLRGDLQGAQKKLAAIQKMNMTPDFAEKVLYLQARIDLISGNLDSADVGYKRVIERFPSGLYVNDAVSAMMILQQGAEGDPRLMDLYSLAERYKDMHRPDSLVPTLEQIANHEDTSLADVALLELGKYALSQGDTTGALTRLVEISQRFPASYFAPHAAKLKADIYFKNPDKRSQAMAIYRSLLKDYSTYPFSAEIRKKLRDAGESPEDQGTKKRAQSDA